MKKIPPKALSELREKIHKEQNNICPLLKQEFPVENMVVDHQHKLRNSQTIGEDGAGLIRGVIHRQANIIEGKISKNWRRIGMHTFGITMPEFLRNLADYLERENLQIIHPSELPRRKKLKKSSYNTLKKAYNGKAKFPEYSMRGGKPNQFLTKKLAELFEKYNIQPEFYD